MNQHQNWYRQRLSHLGLFDQSENLAQPENMDFSQNILSNLRNGGPACLLHIGSISWVIQRPIEVYDTKGNFVLCTKRFNACAPIQIQYEDFGETVGHWKPRNQNVRKIENQQYGNCLFEAISAQTSFDPNQLRLLTYLRMREIQKQLEINKFFIQNIHQNDQKMLMMGAGLKLVSQVAQCLKKQQYWYSDQRNYSKMKSMLQFIKIFMSGDKYHKWPIEKKKISEYEQQRVKNLQKQIQFQLIKIYIKSCTKFQIQDGKLKFSQQQQLDAKNILKTLKQEQFINKFNTQAIKNGYSEINQQYLSLIKKKFDQIFSLVKDTINQYFVNYFMLVLRKIQKNIILNGENKLMIPNKQGQSLLLELINHEKQITIKITKDQSTHFQSGKLTVYFNIDEQNTLQYKEVNDVQNKSQIIQPDITIYHQLCHAYRFLKGFNYKIQNQCDSIILFRNIIYGKVQALELEQLETVGCIRKGENGENTKYSQNFYRREKVKQIDGKIKQLKQTIFIDDNLNKKSEAQQNKKTMILQQIDQLQQSRQNYPLRKYYNPKLSLQLQFILCIIFKNLKKIQNVQKLLLFYKKIKEQNQSNVGQKQKLQADQKQKQVLNQLQEVKQNIKNFDDIYSVECQYKMPSSLPLIALDEILLNYRQISEYVFKKNDNIKAQEIDFDVKLYQYLEKALEYLIKYQNKLKLKNVFDDD